jgi:hypothetical protein
MPMPADQEAGRGLLRIDFATVAEPDGDDPDCE